MGWYFAGFKNPGIPFHLPFMEPLVEPFHHVGEEGHIYIHLIIRHENSDYLVGPLVPGDYCLVFVPPALLGYC